MKKLFFLLTLAVPFLAGCSETEVLSGESSAVLSFDTHIGKSSRALAVSRFEEGDAIGVYMYHTPTDWATNGIGGSSALMENVALRLDAGAWIYNPTLFWKQNEKYTFFAYAPYKEKAVINDGTLSYTVGADETKQEDLLYSVPSVQTKDKSWNGSAALPGKVQFVFTHALSQVKFSVATEYDYSSLYTIELTDIKLNNIYNSGNLNLVAESSTVEPWNNLTASGSIDYSPAKLTLGLDLQTITNATGDVWMLLPQTLPADAEVEFMVHLTKVGTQGTAVDGDYKLKASLATGVWEHNKVYNYQLTLNMNQILGVRPIVIGDPIVIDWEEETPEEIYPVFYANVPDAEADSTATSYTLIKSYMKSGSEVDIMSVGSPSTWTATVSADAQSWLSLADSESGTGATAQKNGIGNSTLYIYPLSEVASNGADRRGMITIRRTGAKDITIHVTQGDFVYIDGMKWARGNIRLDESGRIVQDRPDYGGLYFQYGSLIGATTTPVVFDGTSTVGYRPAEFTGVLTDWHSVPNSSTDIAGTYNASAGTGDICKYLSDKKEIGAVNTTWRLPTKDEADKLVRMPMNTYGDFADISSSPVNPVPSGCFLGKYAASATDPVNLPERTMFLPAAGVRYMGVKGEFMIYGRSIAYWTGTMGETNPYQMLRLTVTATNLVVNTQYINQTGYQIRCVRSN